jgi:protein-tyrosine phosphatase
MAESVFTYMVKERGLQEEFYINSAATSYEEIGNTPHYGTVNKLRAVGIPLVPHRAVRMTQEDYEEYDYLIGMDTANIRNMTRIAGGDKEQKIYKLMTFADSGRDVADPWYTGDFESTYRDVTQGCEAFLKYLERKGEI